MKATELLTGITEAEMDASMRMIEPPGNTEVTAQLLAKIDAINAHGTANSSNGDLYLSNDDVPQPSFSRRLQAQAQQAAQPAQAPPNPTSNIGLRPATSHNGVDGLNGLVEPTIA